MNLTIDIIDQLDIAFGERTKKAIRDKNENICFHIDYARAIHKSLLRAKWELSEINKDQNPEDYAHLNN